MYLTYSEYQTMGGVLDETAFIPLERKSEYIINSQSGGQTGQRIIKLTELPQAIKDCMFELISFLAESHNCQINSESQSSDGVSESYSYVTNEEVNDLIDDIIYTYLISTGLLYRGAKYD